MDLSVAHNLNPRQLSDVLATNYVPTGAEARQIKISLEEDERSIQAADLRISSLERQLEEERARRNALIESAARKRSLFAAVRKISPEILGEIFGWCNDIGIGAKNPRISEWCHGVGVERSVPTGWITPDCTPLVLVRICRLWRRTAQGTPRLWDTLAIHSTFTKNPSIIIPMWLRNSGSIPIDIFVDVIGRRHSELFRALPEHLHRCRTLYLDGNLSSLKEIIPPGTVTSTPFLHNLWTGRSPGSVPKHEMSGNLDSGSVVAPTLRSLVCTLPLLLKLIPMDHLTSTFLPLRHLCLQWSTNDDIIGVLSRLRPPALESLSLVSYEESPPGLTATLREFLSSAPLLKELRLVGTHGIHLTSLMDQLKRLESLSILGLHPEDDFMDGLTPDPDTLPSTWAIPCLSSLHLDFFTISGAELVKMIRRRVTAYNSIKDKDDLSGAKPLTRFELSLDLFPLNEEHLDALEALSREVTWFSFSCKHTG